MCKLKWSIGDVVKIFTGFNPNLLDNEVATEKEKELKAKINELEKGIYNYLVFFILVRFFI